jgi:glycosyltransferase involved in cell wall biosynthesis
MVNKKKLLIITNFCLPEVGAAPYRIFNMAKELNKRDFDVQIISSMPNYPKGKIFDEYKGKLYKKEELEGIVCRRFWLYPSNSNNPLLRALSMISFSFSLLFAIPSIVRINPKAIIVQSPPLLTGLTSVILGKILRKKIILNISDVWPLTAIELKVMKEGGLSHKIFSFIEKINYKWSYAFIGQSMETCNYLKTIVKIKPVYLYRNLSNNDDSGVENLNLLTNKKIKIVYAGLLGLAQDVLNICKLIDFEKYGCEFHIYGNGVQKDEIAEFAKNSKSIFLYETLSKEEIQSKLLSYHATIIPLKDKIFGAVPSKIYMAISASLPIIFMGDGEGAEVVNKYKLGFVSGAGDIEGLLKNIILFSNLTNEEIELLKKNFELARNGDFNYLVQQEELARFLNEIL